MGLSFRDDFYRRPNFATLGTEIPERLIRRLPAWADNPPISPANPNNPYGDPPRLHEVDPPERNPYNDLDYSPFIVTEIPSANIGVESDYGGLLRMMRATMQDGQVRPSVVSDSNGESEYPDSNDSRPGGLLGRLLAVHDEWLQNAADIYRNNSSGEVGARTYATPLQVFPATAQQSVWTLSRRLAR